MLAKPQAVLVFLASEVRSGNWPTAAAEPGNRFPAPAESGGTNSTEAAASGARQADPFFLYHPT
eukprot:1872811-Amphidinium_carterae.1